MIDSNKKFLISIFIAGLALRLLFLTVGLMTDGREFIYNFSDAIGYTNLAKNIVDGNGFSAAKSAPFLPSGLHTPGYPAFLSVFYLISGNFFPVVFMQIILSASLSIIAYFILRKLDFSERISRIASTVTALEPLFAAYSVFLLTETLFIFLLFLALYFYLSFFRENEPVWKILVAALFLGLTVLTRPVGLYLIPIFTLLIIIGRGRLAYKFGAAAIFFAVGIGVISPWLWRNWQVFGRFSLSTIDAHNLYFKYAGGVLAMENGYSIDKAGEVLRDELREARIENTADTGFAQELRKRAMSIIFAHPVSFFKLNALTAWQFFTHEGYYDLAVHLGFYKDNRGPPITILDFKNSLYAIPALLLRDPLFFIFISGRLLWIAVFFLFLIGVFLSLRNSMNRRRDIFLGLFVGYLFVASLIAGYAINARFRLPIMPFYVAYAIWSVTFLLSKYLKYDIKEIA